MKIKNLFTGLAFIAISCSSVYAYSINNVSYTLGYQMGQQIVKDKIDISSSHFAQGIQDALDGKKPMLSESQMQQSMEDLGEVLMQIHEADEPESKSNSQLSDQYMAAVAEIKNIKKIDNGVYVKIITKGKGVLPKYTDTVEVNYQGTTPAETYDSKQDKELLDGNDLLGKTFDKSSSPASFGLNQVIPCWTKALQEVPVGSQVIIYCAPDQAYGSYAPAAIGADQALSFKVSLLSIK